MTLKLLAPDSSHEEEMKAYPTEFVRNGEKTIHPTLFVYLLMPKKVGLRAVWHA